MYYLSRSEHALSLKLGADATTADKLIAAFDRRTDVCYLLVTFDPQLGVLLTLLNKGRKDALKLPNGSDDTARFSELYGAARLTSSKRLLLMFFFASEKEMRRLLMHPASLTCNTTFGTENTKKELFDIAGLDRNNKGFNAGRAYIPIAQEWVFYYAFKHCLPVLWGPVITQRVSLMCTDGCTQ
jgi:hypothetical protein